MKANSAVDKNILEEALQDLIHRVDDWKSHKVDNFGSLLLHGVYTVITGKSEQEKDVRISPGAYDPPLCCTDNGQLTFLSSMRSIFLRIYCSVARKSPQLKPRTRRTRRDHPYQRCGTSSQSYNSRAASS